MEKTYQTTSPWSQSVPIRQPFYVHLCNHFLKFHINMGKLDTVKIMFSFRLKVWTILSDH